MWLESQKEAVQSQGKGCSQRVFGVLSNRMDVSDCLFWFWPLLIDSATRKTVHEYCLHPDFYLPIKFAHEKAANTNTCYEVCLYLEYPSRELTMLVRKWMKHAPIL